MPKCAYLLNAYDATKVPRLIPNHDPKNFVTNRCRATPNISPDSPLYGESGEVFGVALHLFITKISASRVMDYPWHNLASYAFRRWAAFGIICSKGLINLHES